MIQADRYLVFDLEDRFARERGVRGFHPRPLGKVWFKALSRRTEAGTEAFQPVLELKVVQNALGFFVYRNRVSMRQPFSNSEQVFRDTLTHETVVQVEGDFYRSRQFIVTPEATVVGVDLEVGYNYPFPRDPLPDGTGQTLLYGAVLGADGQGVAESEIRLSRPAQRYLTDESGQWVFHFPSSGSDWTVDLEIKRPGSAPEEINDLVVRKGMVNRLASTGLRGRVVTSNGRPVRDAAICVVGHAGRTLTDLDGFWSYFFPFSQPQTTVTLEVKPANGPIHSVENVAVVPGTTKTLPQIEINRLT